MERFDHDFDQQNAVHRMKQAKKTTTHTQKVSTAAHIHHVPNTVYTVGSEVINRMKLIRLEIEQSIILSLTSPEIVKCGLCVRCSPPKCPFCYENKFPNPKCTRNDIEMLNAAIFVGGRLLQKSLGKIHCTETYDAWIEDKWRRVDSNQTVIGRHILCVNIWLIEYFKPGEIFDRRLLLQIFSTLFLEHWMLFVPLYIESRKKEIIPSYLLAIQGYT